MGFALDFPGPRNTQILAPASGIATYAEGTLGFANFVRMESIDPDNSWRIDLAHLDHSNLTPGVPTSVQIGDLIGFLGDSGQSTGLHVHDIEQLLGVLHRLRDRGNTVVVIEHNLDVIKTADWIIDLGPEGGDGGGEVIATGTPEQVAANSRSFTGQYLKPLVGSIRAKQRA